MMSLAATLDRLSRMANRHVGAPYFRLLFVLVHLELRFRHASVKWVGGDRARNAAD